MTDTKKPTDDIRIADALLDCIDRDVDDLTETEKLRLVAEARTLLFPELSAARTRIAELEAPVAETTLEQDAKSLQDVFNERVLFLAGARFGARLLAMASYMRDRICRAVATATAPSTNDGT